MDNEEFTELDRLTVEAFLKTGDYAFAYQTIADQISSAAGGM